MAPPRTHTRDRPTTHGQEPPNDQAPSLSEYQAIERLVAYTISDVRLSSFRAGDLSYSESSYSPRCR